MTAAERIDAALQVALEVTVTAANAGEITPHDAAQVVDVVTAALNVVRSWGPEWETAGVDL